MTLLNFIIAFIGVLIGFLLNAYLYSYVKKRKSQLKEINDDNIIECEDCDLPYLKDEWQTTIQTQMHFNELIIKFRSIVLSVFVTGLGIIYGISDNIIATNKFNFIIILAFTFWTCCFLLDCFYYQKLLSGAVEHAKKFDNNDFFRKKGLFGLTKRISFELPNFFAKTIIILFYIIPTVVLAIIVYLKQ